MDLLEKYWQLPVWLQNISLSAYSLILQERYYGDGYRRNCETFDQQEFWSRVQIDQWQLAEIQKIIAVAARYVPHYQDSFKKAGVRPEDIQSINDIRRLPVLNKETIRENARKLVDARLDIRQLIQDRTSGSTGTPLQIFWPKKMFKKWWSLHERRVRKWAGVSQSIPRAMVGGRPIVPGDSHGPYWRYNLLWRQLYLSSYHIAPATSPGYIDAIIHYGSHWITGYGSAISLLGEWLCEHPNSNVNMIAALTSGDTLLASQRKFIEMGFNCRVFDYYGSSEGCLVISECEKGRLHVQPESGFLEIVNERDEPCLPGEIGEMLITGLLNDSMPLIRYRIGDLAAWSEEIFCPCGRHSPLVSHIEGRTDDYLLLPDGRRIGRLSTAIKKSLEIRGAQIVQDSPDHAWLLLLPGQGYLPLHGKIIKEDILSRIGNFSIDIHEVEQLPKNKVGKQNLVVKLFSRPDLVEIYKEQLPKIPWKC